MSWNWYKLFNLTEFYATGLVSRTYKLFLEDIGEKEITVFYGTNVNPCILYEGVLLPAFFYDGRNPYIGLGDTYGVYIGEEVIDEVTNEFFYLGIAVA